MPRVPKPYEYRGWYCTSVGGHAHHKLCPVDEGMGTATRQLRLWLAEIETNREKTPSPGPGVRPPADPARVLVHQAHDDYLDAVKSEVSPDTYDGYIEKLKPFYDRFGNRTVRSLTEQDGLTYKTYLMQEKEWLKGGKKPGQKSTRMKGLGPVTVNHHLRVAKQFLNWASKEKRRYCLRNPWQDIKSLPQKPRERLITDEELRHLLAQTNDADFRDMLFVMRYSTFRPPEARIVAWEMVFWDDHQIRLPRTMVKTRKPRTITLIPEVEERLRLRFARTGARPSDLIFPGHNGEVWKTTSLCQKFRRLVDRCARLGLVEREKAGERLVPYSTRHTRGTELLREVGDLLTVSKEMGHAQVSTTANHYLHLQDRQVTDLIRSRRAAACGADSAAVSNPGGTAAAAPSDSPSSTGPGR